MQFQNAGLRQLIILETISIHCIATFIIVISIDVSTNGQNVCFIHLFH